MTWFRWYRWGPTQSHSVLGERCGVVRDLEGLRLQVDAAQRVWVPGWLLAVDGHSLELILSSLATATETEYSEESPAFVPNVTRG